MANNAQYASTVASGGVIISTANTARDGTGTLGTVITAGANGTRLDDLSITATGTTTGGMVRLFLHNGTTAFLWREVPVTAVTPSATVATFSTTLQGLALLLPNGWSLRASTHNAESFSILPTRGGHF